VAVRKQQPALKQEELRAENTQEWKIKPQYGQFARETENQSNEDT